MGKRYQANVPRARETGQDDLELSLTAPAANAGAVFYVNAVLWYNPLMDDLRQTQTVKQPAETSEYETFKTGLRQILSVPKSEIDKREAEYQEQQQQKPPRKKKAA